MALVPWLFRICQKNKDDGHTFEVSEWELLEDGGAEGGLLIIGPLNGLQRL
jgi:hypothetical protein